MDYWYAVRVQSGWQLLIIAFWICAFRYSSDITSDSVIWSLWFYVHLLIWSTEYTPPTFHQSAIMGIDLYLSDELSKGDERQGNYKLFQAKKLTPDMKWWNLVSALPSYQHPPWPAKMHPFQQMISSQFLRWSISQLHWWLCFYTLEIVQEFQNRTSAPCNHNHNKLTRTY